MFGTFSERPRRNMVTSPGFRPAVATWYSNGWKVLYTLRSMRVTRTRTSRSASTACAPAKPPPRITTWGQLAPSFAGTVGRRVRNGSGRTIGRTPCAAERRSGRGWWPGGSRCAGGRGAHLGGGRGTARDRSRVGGEMVGGGRGAESGPFGVPADGPHSAPSGPRTERGGATRDTRKAIPSGGG